MLEIQPASLSLAQLVEARSERPCVCGFAEVSESFVRKPDGKRGKTPGESPRGRLPAFLTPLSPRTSAPTVPRPSAGASAASARRLATTTSAVCLCLRRDRGEVQRRSETEKRPRRRVVATVRPRERVKRRSNRCREWGRLAGQLGIVDGDFRILPRHVYTPPAYLFFARASRRARMRRRSAPVANRLIARRSQNRRAYDVPDRIQTRLANPRRSPDPRVERCAGRATRRSRGATRVWDLAHGRAERARVEVPRSRVPKAARSCFLVSGMSRHESSRAPEKGVQNGGLVTTEPHPRAAVEAKDGANPRHGARRAPRVAPAVDGRRARRPRRDARETARASFFGPSRVGGIARDASRSIRPSRDGESRRRGGHPGAHQTQRRVRGCPRAPPARAKGFASSVSSVSSRLVQAHARQKCVPVPVESAKFHRRDDRGARARASVRNESRDAFTKRRVLPVAARVPEACRPGDPRAPRAGDVARASNAAAARTGRKRKRKRKRKKKNLRAAFSSRRLGAAHLLEAHLAPARRARLRP